MNNPQMILIVLAGISLAILGCCLCTGLVLHARAQARDGLALALSLEGELQSMSQDLDTVRERAADQGRRLAWLESRLRTGGAPPPEAPAESEAVPAAKQSITERRHRVLSLARTGLDPASIAATLGVPHGEVELIIGLSKAA